MTENSIQTPEFVERLKDAFDEMVVYKDLKKSNFISSFKLPSFMRDWVLKHFQNDEGEIDIDGAVDFIRQFIPKKDDWKSIVNRVVNQGDTVQFLAKIAVNIDIGTQTSPTKHVSAQKIRFNLSLSSCIFDIIGYMT